MRNVLMMSWSMHRTWVGQADMLFCNWSVNTWPVVQSWKIVYYCFRYSVNLPWVTTVEQNFLLLSKQAQDCSVKLYHLSIFMREVVISLKFTSTIPSSWCTFFLVNAFTRISLSHFFPVSGWSVPLKQQCSWQLTCYRVSWLEEFDLVLM